MEENFRILKPFIRGFLLIILSMVIAVVVAKKYLSYVIPMYESTTKLKLADVGEGVPSSNLFKDFDVFASANKIAAEIEVLKSSILLNKTLDSLDFDVEVYRKGQLKSVELYHDSPLQVKGDFNSPKAFDKKYGLKVISDTNFEITLPGAEQSLIAGKFGEPVSFQYGQIFISLDKKYIASKPNVALVDQYEFEFLSRQKLIGKISKNLDIVSVDKDVAIIRINFKNPVPAKAALFVNTLAKSYIQDYIEAKYKAAETTVVFLDKQLIDVARKLSRQESDIEDYRNTQKIVNIRQETETDLRKIAQLKIQQTNVKMNLLAIESLNEYIQNGKENFLELAPNFEAFTDLLSTEIIKSIKSLQAEKKDLLITYTPEEEQVKVIDAKINDLTNYLIESIANTKRNLEIKYANLTKDIETFEKVFISVPEKEKIMTLMNREFEIYQKTYISLNEKKIEAEIAKAAKIAFHRIIHPAEPSKEPVSPNRPIIIIVAAIMGMFGSIVLIHLVHLAKAKVNDAYTIEKNSGLPIALLTPYFRKKQMLQEHFLKEAIQLELKGILKDKTTLVFSSNRNNEGRAFHALNLSKSLAIQGRKVLLADVGGDLSYITKSEENVKSPSETSFKNIAYLSFDDPNFNRFSKAVLRNLLNEYKALFDVIIVNNESLENETKGLLFMSVADTNLFVLDSRRTPAKQIIKTDILKQEFKLPDTWFVLNKEGYNPNVALYTIQCIGKMISKRKKGNR